jgi:hypothetical protein
MAFWLEIASFALKALLGGLGFKGPSALAPLGATANAFGAGPSN